MRTAKRTFVIIAIVLNLIQVFPFQFSNFGYECLFGLHSSIDLLSGSMSMGLDLALEATYNSSPVYIPATFRVNFLALIVAAYSIDQLRFIPKEKKMSGEILDIK